MNDGNDWELISSETVGSYLLFAMAGSGQFAIVPETQIAWWVWELVTFAAFVFTFALTVWKKQKRTHKRHTERM